jgi:hypothetical protein
VLLAGGVVLFVLHCAPPEHLTERIGGVSGNGGTQGSAGTGAAGTTGAAGDSGAAGDGSLAGTTGSAGTTAAAGTTGTAGTGAAGTGAAGTGAAGTTAAAGTTGTAGTTAAAGTTGTAGTGAAGTGAAGTGAAGTGGPTVNGCLNANWVFTPNYICVNPPNPSCGFQASAREPINAIDGNTATRYTSGKTQSGDENFVITFGGRVRLTGITIMTTDATDYMRAYRVEYSATDGTTFTAFNPAVMGTGQTNLTITFPATTMKAIKVYQTGMVAAPATSWWSIHEITLTGCTPQ